MRKTLSVTPLWLASLLYGGSLELNLNDKSVETALYLHANDLLGYPQGSDYTAFVRYLNRDDSLVSAGFSVTGPIEGAESFRFGGGIMAVFSDNYTAVPLFLQIRYTLPLDEPIPQTTLLSRVAYAPSVLSFSDADSFVSFRIEADMQMIPHFHFYTGYRNIQTDYTTYDRTFDNGWYAGLRFTF